MFHVEHSVGLPGDIRAGGGGGDILGGFGYRRIILAHRGLIGAPKHPNQDKAHEE